MALDVVEFPEDIAWLDLSFNDITSISNDILEFPALKMIYLHGNKIRRFADIIFKAGNSSMSLLIDVMLLKLKSSQAISSGNSTTSRAILKAKSTVRNPLKQ